MFSPTENPDLLPVGGSARMLLADLLTESHVEWLMRRWVICLSAHDAGVLDERELALANHLIFSHGDPVARSMN